MLIKYSLNIVKIKTAFSGYAQSCKNEIVEKIDVVVELKASKISIAELFKGLLIELKGIILAVLYYIIYKGIIFVK